MFAPVHVVSAVAQCREDLRAFNRDARARCRINGADDEVEGCFFRVVNDGAVGKDQSDTGMGRSGQKHGQSEGHQDTSEHERPPQSEFSAVFRE